MHNDHFYVCLDARHENVSLLRRLAGSHFKAAGMAGTAARQVQAGVVQRFAETARRRRPGQKLQVEVEITTDDNPSPRVAVRERRDCP